MKKSFPISFMLMLMLMITVCLLFGCSVSPESVLTDPNQEQQNISLPPDLTPEALEDNQTENPQPSPPNAPGFLNVHFIDVGQADCILIITPEGKTMLIDAGNNADSNLVVNYLKKQEISKIDILIGTHPHEDHIGGLDSVIENFEIKSVYLPKVSHNTKSFEDVLLAIKVKGLKIKQAKGDISLDLGSDVIGEMLAPNSNNYKDLNDYSAVVKISFGNNSFLFTGDAEQISEQEMLSKDYALNSDVLKIGHHGSNSSTSSSFLKAVAPTYAIISVGDDNTYGHPSPKILNRLTAAKIKIYRTDLSGTIVATSDGETIQFKTESSPTTAKKAKITE